MVRVGWGMSFGTSLSRQGEGDLLTAGLSNDNLLLLNSVGGISELGDIEALVLNLVLTLDFGDLDGLGDTDLLGSWVGKAAGNLKGLGDKGNLVGLGLVLLPADLVFTLSTISITMASMAISSSPTGSHLHGLRLLVKGDLGGGAGGGDILPLIHVGADLSFNDGGGLLTDGEDTVKAVVIVNNLLDCKGDGGHLLSKGGDTDLSVDGGVGVSACVCWGIGRSSMISSVSADTSNKCGNKYKHDVDCTKT